MSQIYCRNKCLSFNKMYNIILPEVIKKPRILMLDDGVNVLNFYILYSKKCLSHLLKIYNNLHFKNFIRCYDMHAQDFMFCIKCITNDNKSFFTLVLYSTNTFVGVLILQK